MPSSYSWDGESHVCDDAYDSWDQRPEDSGHQCDGEGEGELDGGVETYGREQISKDPSIRRKIRNDSFFLSNFIFFKVDICISTCRCLRISEQLLRERLRNLSRIKTWVVSRVGQS